MLWISSGWRDGHADLALSGSQATRTGLGRIYFWQQAAVQPLSQQSGVQAPSQQA